MAMATVCVCVCVCLSVCLCVCVLAGQISWQWLHGNGYKVTVRINNNVAKNGMHS